MSTVELTRFMNSLANELHAEYERIRSRVIEDPGTAGDQAEENWAGLLRNWLPATYPIVTKGRIINEEGDTSPQVDILVLRPSYPRFLRDKKLYFAGGVVGAFECKLSLRPSHLNKAFETARKIKALYEPRAGNPYVELHAPILFGVLAHSHAWPRTSEWVVDRIAQNIDRYQAKLSHPRDSIDVICIADTATFVCTRDIFAGRVLEFGYEQKFVSTAGLPDAVSLGFTHFETRSDSFPQTVLGTLVNDLTSRLAREDETLRPYADYLDASSTRSGSAYSRAFRLEDCFTPNVVEQLRKSGPSIDEQWSSWGCFYP